MDRARLKDLQQLNNEWSLRGLQILACQSCVWGNAGRLTIHPSELRNGTKRSTVYIRQMSGGEVGLSMSCHVLHSIRTDL